MEGFSLRASRGSTALPTLWFWTPALRNRERIHFCCLFSIVNVCCHNKCWPSWETNTLGSIERELSAGHTASSRAANALVVEGGLRGTPQHPPHHKHKFSSVHLLLYNGGSVLCSPLVSICHATHCYGAIVLDHVRLWAWLWWLKQSLPSSSSKNDRWIRSVEKGLRALVKMYRKQHHATKVRNAAEVLWEKRVTLTECLERAGWAEWTSAKAVGVGSRAGCERQRLRWEGTGWELPWAPMSVHLLVWSQPCIQPTGTTNHVWGHQCSSQPCPVNVICAKFDNCCSNIRLELCNHAHFSFFKMQLLDKMWAIYLKKSNF